MLLEAIRSIWKLLSPKQRRTTVLLFALMLGGMAFETVGIALIIPLFGLIGANPSGLAVWVSLKAKFGLEQQQLVLLAVLTFVLFYFVKAVFLGILSWRQARFVYKLHAELSDAILGLFVAQPMEFHFQRHSTELGRQALQDTSQFSRGAVMSCLAMATESCVLVGLCGLLLLVEPWTTLSIVFLLSFSAAIFHNYWRHTLFQWGVQRQAYEGKVHQRLHESLTAIKEIKLSGQEKEFLRRYREPSTGFATIASNQVALESIPRLGLELLTVSSISILAAGLALRGTEFDTILPTLAVFAAAASRLLPSVGRLLNHVNYLRFSMPVIRSISSEFERLRNFDAATGSSNALAANVGPWETIEIRNICYTYPNRQEAAIAGLNLTIQRGERLGIVGPTGAGKSTLIDILLGLLKPSAGEIRAGKFDIVQNPRAWHRIIGYVPQETTLLDDTLRRNIAFGMPDDKIDERALLAAIETAQLTEFVSELEQGLETTIGERGNRLSGGQRQRIAIARALYKKPEILILDEASNGLDDATESALLKAITKLPHNPTIVMVAHRASTKAFCTRLCHVTDLQTQAAGLIPNQLRT